VRCAIMQPTFLPWAGYFDLIKSVNIFVFLNDVQFEKQSWQNRNRILLHGSTSWITVPVMYGGLNQTINEVKVCDKKPWRSKILKTLTQGYAKHEHHGEMLELAALIEAFNTDALEEINIALIKAACEKLEITTRFVRSSDLAITGGRTQRLIRICQRLECDEYLSPRGSMEYLAMDRFVEKTNIRLSFQEFVPKQYSQHKANQFVANLSIIDVVANLGWAQTKSYIS
jgi:hypothetical protein